MSSSRSNIKRSIMLEPSQKIEVVRRLGEDKQNPNDLIEFIKTEYNRIVTVKYIRSISRQFRKAKRVNREPFSDTGGVVYYDLPNTNASLCLISVSFRTTTRADFYFKTNNST